MPGTKIQDINARVVALDQRTRLTIRSRIMDLDGKGSGQPEGEASMNKLKKGVLNLDGRAKAIERGCGPRYRRKSRVGDPPRFPLGSAGLEQWRRR